MKNKKGEIILNEVEYNYLINNLLRNNENILSQLEAKRINNGVVLKLSTYLADEIRELAGNEVGLHFDINYQPTEVGWILENLIDKFYFP